MFKSCMLKTSHVPVRQNSNMQGHNMTTHGLLKKGGFQHSSFASLPRPCDLQHDFVEQVLAKDTLRNLSKQKKRVDRLTHYYQPILPDGDIGTH